MAQWCGRRPDRRVSDQLARHATASDQPELALDYLIQAADRSRHAASHRREAALLADALSIAKLLNHQALEAELHARRGKALSRVALWAEAHTELQASLASLPADNPGWLRRRAEVHCDLSAVCFWLLDTAGIGDHARAALDLATQIGAHEVELAARAQLTSADSATGM